MKRQTTLFCLLLLLIWGWNSSLAYAQKQNNTYQFSLDLNKVENDQLKVTLIAPKIKGKKTVYYLPKIIPGTYSFNDYGRFVTRLEAFNKRGKKLKVKRLDNNSWEIKKAKKIHKVVYWVDDSYDSKLDDLPYPMGGTNIEKGKNVVINTHGFFGYFAGMKELPYVVNIKRPEKFYGSTGLIPSKTSKTEDTFTTENYMVLVDSPMMYNEPDTTIIKVADTEVLISVYSPNGLVQSSFVADNIRGLLMAQKEYLGGDLPVEKYAFIFYLVEPRKSAPMQGALEHSYSSFYYLPEVPQSYLAPVILDVAAHEFFHIITPLNIHSEEIHYFNYNEPKLSQHLWLYEGVTEYFAGNVQVQYQIIDYDTYLEKLQGKMRASTTIYNDTLPFTTMSTQCADKYKDQYGNVYEKGALIAMCLDIKLLQLSDGKYGIRNLMAELSEKYGKDKPFKDSELFQVIEKMTYPEIGKFLRKHVSGTTPLPFSEVFSLVGLNYKDKEAFEEFSIGGGTDISFNSDSKRLFVAGGLEKMNEFGKELGYQVGDELLRIAGKEIPEPTQIRRFLDDVRANLKEGEEVEIVVLRKNEEGVPKEVPLKAKARKVQRFKYHKMSLSNEASPEQLKLRKAWLDAPKNLLVKAQTASGRGGEVIDNNYEIAPEKVATVQSTVTALYDFVSGKAGERNWAEMRALCKPDAQMNAIVTNPQTGEKTYRSMTIDGYRQMAGMLFKMQDFHEKELNHKVERFANIAHVFSTFEIRLGEDKKLAGQGINSIQLVYDNDRWWIVNVLWDSATPDMPIPKEYLGEGD